MTFLFSFDRQIRQILICESPIILGERRILKSTMAEKLNDNTDRQFARIDGGSYRGSNLDRWGYRGCSVVYRKGLGGSNLNRKGLGGCSVVYRQGFRNCSLDRWGYRGCSVVYRKMQSQPEGTLKMQCRLPEGPRREQSQPVGSLRELSQPVGPRVIMCPVLESPR